MSEGYADCRIQVSLLMNIALEGQFFMAKRGLFAGHSPKTLDVDFCVSDWL